MVLASPKLIQKKSDVEEIISLYAEVYNKLAEKWSHELHESYYPEIASRLTQTLWFTRKGLDISARVQEFPKITIRNDEK